MVLPSAKKASFEMPMACPPETMKPSPRTISIMASVVISALILTLAMITPFTAPMKAPATRLAPIPSAMLPEPLITVAQSRPEKATIEPTERSKSRQARQNIMVHATMPICETESARPTRFWIEKKYSTLTERTAKRTMKMRMRLHSSRNMRSGDIAAWPLALAGGVASERSAATLAFVFMLDSLLM